MDVEETVTKEMSENIQLIADWMRNEAPFNGRTDPSFILNFLSICSNDVEKTKQRIGRYYELRKLYPTYTKNRDVSDEKLKKLIFQGVITSDANVKSAHPVVLLIKLGRLESEDSAADCLRLGLICGEIGLLDSPRVRQHGCVVVYDMENMTFSHAMQLTPSTTAPSNDIATEGTPIRQIGLHFINVGFVFTHIINLCRFALPAGLSSVLHVHSGGWECLSGNIPAACLPIEYGGTNGNIQEGIEYLWNNCLKWREYLLDDEKYGYSDDNPDEN